MPIASAQKLDDYGAVSFDGSLAHCLVEASFASRRRLNSTTIPLIVQDLCEDICSHEVQAVSKCFHSRTYSYLHSSVADYQIAFNDELWEVRDL